MNNLLLGGQQCTDSVDIQQAGDTEFGRDRLAIIPRLNFTCNGRITSIRARLRRINSGRDYLFFQVWRPASVGSTIYNKTSEIQLQSSDKFTGTGNIQTATITLTGNTTIEVQSGDVVGYYHPSDSRYVMRDISIDGYYLYRFDGPPAADSSEDLSQANFMLNNRRPLLQFVIGM